MQCEICEAEINKMYARMEALRERMNITEEIFKIMDNEEGIEIAKREYKEAQDELVKILEVFIRFNIKFK